jgi:hypothetical protein
MGATKSDTEYVFQVNLKGSRRVARTIALRGDQTLHEGTVEAVNPSVPRAKYPQMRASRGASPPQYEAVDE